MSVKKNLCQALQDRKRGLGWTYDKIHEDTGIAKSQLVAIFKHGGRSVSLEHIEVVAECMGVAFEVHAFFDLDVV